jgi:hypothetical protein
MHPTHDIEGERPFKGMGTRREGLCSLGRHPSHIQQSKAGQSLETVELGLKELGRNSLRQTWSIPTCSGSGSSQIEDPQSFRSHQENDSEGNRDTHLGMPP